MKIFGGEKFGGKINSVVNRFGCLECPHHMGTHGIYNQYVARERGVADQLVNIFIVPNIILLPCINC